MIVKDILGGDNVRRPLRYGFKDTYLVRGGLSNGGMLKGRLILKFLVCATKNPEQLRIY